MSLAPVLSILKKVGSTRSRKEKEQLLEEGIAEIGEPLEKTILYALDAYRQFNVTQVEYLPPTTAETIDEIFNYLGALSHQRGASNAEKQVLCRLASFDEETVEVVKRIINKDLRCGVGVKTAEKFVEGVKAYGVMKPKTDKKTMRKDFGKFLQLAGGYGNICSSIKVDGVRICDCVVHEDGVVQYFSTNGKLYRNFHCFNPVMIDLAKKINKDYGIEYPMGFDGEVISYDGNFQSVVTQTQRDHDVDTSNLRFLVWGIPTSGLRFRAHYSMARSYLPIVRKPLRQQKLIGPEAKTNVFCLYHNFHPSFNSWKDVEIFARSAINEGEEGIILKVTDHFHERKRSRLWFRLKALYLEGEGVEVDLPVLRWEHGTGKFANLMGALICDYNGEEVRVGGGFKEKQREDFMENTPKWITVNADSETNDKSLRFPQFVREREEK